MAGGSNQMIVDPAGVQLEVLSGDSCWNFGSGGRQCWWLAVLEVAGAMGVGRRKDG